MADTNPLPPTLLKAWNNLGHKVSGVLPAELQKANLLRRATLRSLSQQGRKS